MGDVIPNTRFVKKTPVQRDRLRRKFERRDAAHSSHAKAPRTPRGTTRRRS